MWYVVYLNKPGKNVVLPQTWIRHIDDHIESFLNNRINTAQVFLFYFTIEKEAMDDQGHPNPNFPPKFYMEVDGQFPLEGCYTGRILRVKSKHNPNC